MIKNFDISYDFEHYFLPNIWEDCEIPTTEKGAENQEGNIMSKQDKTLLFMTLAVTLTEKNEMPIVSPYTGDIPEDIMGIHRTNRVSNPKVAPHFYFEDNRIYQYWNKPFETEKLVSRFKCSISMDFSMTNEMGRPQKIYSSFLNKLWAAWLQSRGHAVIPNVSFPDEIQEDYWIEGWPKHSIIAVSSIGVLRHGSPKGWLDGLNRIKEELQPLHIIRYGAKLPGENTTNCTYFTNDNNRSANGR